MTVYTFSEMRNKPDKRWVKFYGESDSKNSIMVTLFSDGRVIIDTKIRAPDYRFTKNTGSKERFENAFQIARKRIMSIPSRKQKTTPLTDSNL